MDYFYQYPVQFFIHNYDPIMTYILPINMCIRKRYVILVVYFHKSAEMRKTNGVKLGVKLELEENEYMDKKEAMLPAISPPGMPESVAISDWGQDFCTLTWSAPKSTGGSNISGYTVEVLEKGFHEWKEAISVNSSTFEGTVKPPIIVLSREYTFRVIANNSAGSSKPSNSTELVKITPFFELMHKFMLDI